ncbi:hypothetical protein UFOVP131_22 [uncultured Caudovirales phage]|uniref:Uncharacterized protein n=1 Tax=uncultured Caudovirales phage TaxID=2100421 RepID=A0A6J5LBN1_9CAUD|nr:hypothetical protein UFOVP131_22 [uncultured Caudovirales phage]
MTLLKLAEHCERTGFEAHINGDAMTAAIHRPDGSLVMTVALK